MAITVDWSARVIHIPQADLTPLGGILYELDTDWLRLQLKALEDDEAGIPHLDTHRHATEVTISGVTYARFFEIINGYTVAFDPDEHYTVRLAGSNNNIADVLGAGHQHVSLVVQNSAGLVVTGGGGGATPGQIADAVWDEVAAGHTVPGSTAIELVGTAAAAAAAVDALGIPADTAGLIDVPSASEVAAAVWDLGDGIEVALTPRQAMRLIAAASAGKLSGAAGTTIRIRDLADTKDRIVATVDADGNRLAITVDGT